MRARLIAVLGIVLNGWAEPAPAQQSVPRFSLEPGSAASRGPVRAWSVISHHGRRASIYGSEDGLLQVRLWPRAAAADVRLRFRVAGEPPIEARTLARDVAVRPEAVTILYAHPQFTVRQHFFAALNVAAAIILLEVQNASALDVFVEREDATDSLHFAAGGGGSHYRALVLGDSVNVTSAFRERADHFRRLRQDVLRLETPDAMLNQAFDWAKANVDLNRGDAPAAALALVATGQLGAARDLIAWLANLQRSDGRITLESLTGGPLRPETTALWLRAAHEYWLGAGDDLFLRQQWPGLQRAFGWLASQAPFGWPWLAALEGVAEMAAQAGDRAAASLADSLAALVNEAGLAASLNATDWGVRMGALVSAPASSAAALLDYRLHRSWSGWRLLRAVSRTAVDFDRGEIPEVLSAAYYDQIRPAGRSATSGDALFLIGVVRGLLGVAVDAPNRAIAIEPHLPPEWNTVAVNDLVVGRERIHMTVRRSPSRFNITLRRSTPGQPIFVRVSPALPLGALVERIRVDDHDVPVQLDESTHDVHPVVELQLSSAAEIDIDYAGGLEVLVPGERPDPGDAPNGVRVLSLRRDQRDYVLELEAAVNSTHIVMLRGGRVRSAAGAELIDQTLERSVLRVRFGAAAGPLARREVRIRL